MSYIIDKFKGIYRIKAPIDLETNDFPRKLNGTYEDIDCYIDCMNNVKIFYYGRSILQVYVPSIIRGHNIVKAIQQINPNLIFDVEEGDSEVWFNFKYSDSDQVIPVLKPKTSGANISPFSSRNRPKSDYKIPDKDLEAYKNIVAKIPPEKVLSITHITNSFVKTLVTKKNTMEHIKADMRLHGVKAKEYIHMIGKWNEYIKYLEGHL